MSVYLNPVHVSATSSRVPSLAATGEAVGGMGAGGAAARSAGGRGAHNHPDGNYIPHQQPGAGRGRGLWLPLSIVCLLIQTGYCATPDPASTWTVSSSTRNDPVFPASDPRPGLPGAWCRYQDTACCYHHLTRGRGPAPPAR